MEQSDAFIVETTEGRVKVSGEIDISSAPVMIEAVMRAMAVELDLSEVTFIDSTGLSGLINLRNSRGALAIVAVSPQVQRVLERTGLVESLLMHNRAVGLAALPRS